jgi:serine/threonine protein kinase, bacterial
VLTDGHVDRDPEDYLGSVGTIFARFDQQDSGNVSYGVAAGGARYFVKTAGHPDDDASFLTHDQRVALLGNAVRLGQSYRHPALPCFHGAVESPHGPMLVYDWADGELIGVPRQQRGDPASAFCRFRSLPATEIIACLDAVVAVHDVLGKAGEVAGDFYDGCLLYDFAARRVALVDLDCYRPGPYRNEMGRMFGSTRFMAPEEFTKGALIDQRTSVFTMGRAVLVLLGDGTTNPEAFRGSVRLLRVATRACQPQPEERYDSLPEFCAAWRAAHAADALATGNGDD